MAPEHRDQTPPEGEEHGVLSDAGSIDTSGIGLVGTPTAHVNVVLPGGRDDSDDDVVDDDVTTDEALEEIEAQIVTDEHEIIHEEPSASEPVTGEVVTDHVEDAAREPEPHEEPEPQYEVEPEPQYEVEPIAQAAPEPAPAVDPVPEPKAAAAPTPAPAPARAVSTPPATTRASAAVQRVSTSPSTQLASKRLGELSEQDRETPDLLTADRLIDRQQVVRPEPEGAWQQFVYTLSGRRINLGDSKRVRARKALDKRIAASLSGGARFVPVVSRKGGVGKTTVTTLLGMALADAREDRVIAVDANPDRGTLAERIARANGQTVRQLVRSAGSVHGYNEFSNVVARDETRLDVLASDADPRVSDAFSDEDYRQVADLAAHYYSIVLTDTGTGIVHSVMGATLDLADQIVVVAGMSVDEARLASETLTWLETNGHAEAVRNAVVVINAGRPGTPLVRADEVEAHFRTRVRDVVRMPYDALIATGSAISFRDLQPATRLAARELAATVVEGLRATSAAA